MPAAARSIQPDLVSALKRLRLGRVLDTLPDRLVLAEKQDMSFDDLLLLILTDEIARRDHVERRLDAAQAFGLFGPDVGEHALAIFARARVDGLQIDGGARNNLERRVERGRCAGPRTADAHGRFRVAPFAA
nr:hypothetical protein [Rhodoglobus sp.]